MRITQLHYLSEVAKSKSINRAAQNLFISQPTLSEALRNLENDLSVTLLERSYNGVSLTEDGKIVLRYAREILKVLEELKLELRMGKSSALALSGSLCISSVPILSATIVHKVLPTFTKQHPLVNLSIVEKNPELVVLDVKNGKCHIGLLIIPEYEHLKTNMLVEINSSKEIHFETLCYDKLVVGVGISSPLSTRKVISIKQLLDYPVAIYLTENNRDHWHLILLRQYGEAKRVYICDSARLYRNLITEGFAAGFFSQSYLRSDPSNEIIPIAIKEAIPLCYGWIRSNNHVLSEAAEEFIKFLLLAIQLTQNRLPARLLRMHSTSD